MVFSYMSFYSSACDNANATKKPILKIDFLLEYSGDDYLLSRKALPSALEYFTSEFEMGSGGTTPV